MQSAQTAPQTTSFVVTTTDGTENVPGACYSLDGGSPVCDDDQNGTVEFQDVTPGTHSLSMTTAPEGYESAIEKGFTYFRTARQMMDIADCRDLTSLQAIIFMILFLQSSAKLSQCYAYIGVARLQEVKTVHSVLRHVAMMAMVF